MKTYDFETYSDDWHRARIGIPTASEFHNILTPGGVPTKSVLAQKSVSDTYNLRCHVPDSLRHAGTVL